MRQRQLYLAWWMVWCLAITALDAQAPSNKELQEQRLVERLAAEDVALADLLIAPNSDDMLPLLHRTLAARNELLRYAAASGLGKLRDPQAVAPLVKLLDDPVAKVREVALWSLGQIESRTVLAQIKAKCQDSHENVRHMAYTVVAHLAQEQELTTLLSGLQDPDDGVRACVVEILSAIGPSVTPELIRLLQSQSVRARIGAIQTLAKLKEPSTIAHIKELLNDRMPTVGAAAAVALLALGEPGTTAALEILRQGNKISQLHLLTAIAQSQDPRLLTEAITLAHSPMPELRRKVITIIGDRKLVKAIPLLYEALQDSDSMVRATAVWATGQMGDAQLLPAIVGKMDDHARDVRCAVITTAALFATGQHADICALFQKALADSEWAVRYLAIVQLGKLKCTHALPALHQILAQHTDQIKVLEVASETLGEIAASESLAVLVQSLTSPHATVRGRSESALVKLVPSCSVKLIELFADQRQPLAARYSIGLVLGRTQAKQTMDIVFRIAADEAETGELRQLALLMLSDWGGAEAGALMLKLVQHPNHRVQSGAITGLGNLKHVPALPRLFELLQCYAPDAAVVEDILWAISRMNVTAVTPLVLAYLAEEKVDRARLAAVRLVGIMKLEGARTLLLQMQADPLWQNPVTWALKELGQ